MGDPRYTGANGSKMMSDERMDVIGQNGNDGDHYEEVKCGGFAGIGKGLKWDADKPRMELLLTGMPRALEAVGQVLTFGAEKYEAHSWQHVENAPDRYYAAQIRHQIAVGKGEKCDPETGLLHLAHEACNVLFRLELALRFQDKIAEGIRNEATSIQDMVEDSLKREAALEADPMYRTASQHPASDRLAMWPSHPRGYFAKGDEEEGDYRGG